MRALYLSNEDVTVCHRPIIVVKINYLPRSPQRVECIIISPLLGFKECHLSVGWGLIKCNISFPSLNCGPIPEVGWCTHNRFPGPNSCSLRMGPVSTRGDIFLLEYHRSCLVPYNAFTNRTVLEFNSLAKVKIYVIHHCLQMRNDK